MTRGAKSIKDRLGQKKSPGKPALETFDARNRLKKLRIEDARQKIQQKSGGVGVQDLRQKVEAGRSKKFEAGRSKKFDARQRIQGKQKNQTVVVTGLGKPLNSISTSPDFSITKTVDNTSQFSRFSRVAGSDGQLKIMSRPPQPPKDLLNMQNAPKIQIKNDMYRPPQKTVVKSAPPRPRVKPFVPHVNLEPPRMKIQPARMKLESPRGRKAVVDFDDSETEDVEDDEEEMMEEEEEVEEVYLPPKKVLASKKVPHESAISAGSDHSNCRVLITNLHPQVTEDDIVELFGAIGTMRKAKLMKPGRAEVVYTSQSNALLACRRYHMRELDGQPMQVVVAKISSDVKPSTSITTVSKSVKPSTSKAAKIPSAKDAAGGILRGTAAHSRKGLKEESVSDDASSEVHEPLRLGKSNARGLKNVDMPLIHRALFKTNVGADPPSKPVAFVVKI